MKMKWILPVLLSLLSVQYAHADDVTTKSVNLVAKNEPSHHATPKSGQLKNTWKPYFVRLCQIDPKRATFFQTNIGIGFLYFSGIRGNLSPSPTFGVSTLLGVTNTRTPLQRGLNYNRSPLVEAVFGYQWNRIVKVGLSYQGQSNVTVFSNWVRLPGVTTAGVAGVTASAQLRSELDLNALSVKAYFNFPYALVIKTMALAPYAAVGVGPCWQTWRRIDVFYVSGSTQAVPRALPLNQKISANAFFTADLGFTTVWTVKNTTFRLLKGMRFNIWGQALSMGKINDQTFAENRMYLTNPLRIRTVYQFAPYLGLSWNF